MRSHTRHRFMGAVVILICFLSIGIAVVLQVCSMETEKQMTLCVHQLRMLNHPLRAFAQSHNGAMPLTISELYPEYITDARVLVCPNVAAEYLDRTGQRHPLLQPKVAPSDIDERSSYALVPVALLDDSADAIVALERGNNHHGLGHAILYADGRGGWEPHENWR